MPCGGGSGSDVSGGQRGSGMATVEEAATAAAEEMDDRQGWMCSVLFF